VEDCRITRNVSKFRGGGVKVKIGKGVFRMSDTIVFGNLANPTLLPIDEDLMFFDAEGGGVFVDGESVIRNCVVAKNTCVSRKQEGISISRGAGIYSFGGHMSLENCLLVENRASAQFFGDSGSAQGLGGGLYLDQGSLEATSCIVACNRTEALGG